MIRKSNINEIFLQKVTFEFYDSNHILLNHWSYFNLFDNDNLQQIKK